MPKKKDISLLDVTIREGSYTINYQYTPEQVGAIAGALDRAGIDYIEVSHGCGLGAANNLGLPAGAADAEYARAARGAAKRAKIGVIAGQPPITQPQDIDGIIDDVDFIRFAANGDDPRSIEGNLRHAKRRRPDLPLLLQLMRCSRCTKREILAAGRFAEGAGIQTIYVVDTAGHFLPEEAGEIVSMLVAKLSIGVGFHGHDNLGLANANSLTAVEAGACAVDASLKGIGRAGGNAQIESLVALLKRRRFAREVDLDLLIEAGQSLVMPFMPPQFGIDAFDLMTADANIDFLMPHDLIEQIALAAGVELSALIRALGSDPETTEAGPAEFARALARFNVDVRRVFRRAGLAPPPSAGRRRKGN